MRVAALVVMLGASLGACYRAQTGRPAPGRSVTLALRAPAAITIRTRGDSVVAFDAVSAMAGRVVADSAARTTLVLGQLELANGQVVRCPGAIVSVADSAVTTRSAPLGGAVVILLAALLAAALASVAAQGGIIGWH